MSYTATTYHHLPLTSQSGTTIFYREAGQPTNPTLLLLHGFPSSSHMFRHLMPLLADKYHVIAPDMPGFGLTTVQDGYKYTFEAMAVSIHMWVKQMKLTKYAVYVFDYGAPVGFRLALADPSSITAIISQNGNAYVEGLTSGWDPIRKYWKENTQENRNALRAFLSPDMVKWQYTHGVKNTELLSPDGYLSDTAFISRPGQMDIQLDLFKDYASNVAMYPRFQAMFKETSMPILAVWGSNDPFFSPPGAEGFKRDSSTAEVHMLDTGHFVLETHLHEMAQYIQKFMSKIGSKM